MKKLTPNQKLKKEVKSLNAEIVILKREIDRLSEILARKRVNETLNDIREVSRFFRDVKIKPDYKREESISAILGLVEKGLRGTQELYVSRECEPKHYNIAGARITIPPKYSTITFSIDVYES